MPNPLLYDDKIETLILISILAPSLPSLRFSMDRDRGPRLRPSDIPVAALTSLRHPVVSIGGQPT
jgi:hypothetical protein